MEQPDCSRFLKPLSLLNPWLKRCQPVPTSDNQCQLLPTTAAADERHLKVIVDKLQDDLFMVVTSHVAVSQVCVPGH